MGVVTRAAERAGRREWVGLGVISLACLIYAMDVTVLHLAVPKLSAALQPTGAQLLWIVDAYPFVLAGFLIPMGTLGDRIGRRRLLLLGAAAFGAASVLAALSTSAEMLIATRAVLGVAGASLAPSTLSLIRSMFLDDEQRAVAIGVWMASFSVGGAVGPLVGGLLLARFWWGSVFLIAVPVMLLLLSTGPHLLPEFRNPVAGRVDLASAAMSLAAVLLVIYGVKQTAQGDAGWLPALPLVGGLVVALAFVRRQRSSANPLIDLALFRRPGLVVALVVYSVATFLAFGLSLYVSQHLQVVLGLTPVRAGLATVPSFLAFIIGSLLASRLVRLARVHIVIASGFALATLGYLLLALTGQYAAGLTVPILIAGITIYSLGLAPVFTLATDMIVRAAPTSHAGAAAAISETGSELGAALGIALLGSAGQAVFRSRMSGAVLVDVPAAAHDVVQGTVAGALQIAAQLPAQSNAALAGSARAAFGHSFEVVSFISAVLAAALAVSVIVLLRHTTEYTADESHTAPR